MPRCQKKHSPAGVPLGRRPLILDPVRVGGLLLSARDYATLAALAHERGEAVAATARALILAGLAAQRPA